MAIAGSMDTWRNRFKGATDVELATLTQEMEQDNPLRPILSDEVLRRSTEMGNAVSQTPTMAMTPPAAPNIPVTIPTAPQALASIPDAPPPPGGRGAPPSDPVTLANRAHMAMQGGDQGTALEIYEWGAENHGQAFTDAFEALKQKARAAYPEREGAGLRSVDPPPPPPVPVPTQAAEQLPMVQPDPLVKVGPNAGVPRAPAGSGYYTSLRGVARDQEERNEQAGRADQEINPPGMPVIQTGPPSAYPDPRQAGRDDQEIHPTLTSRLDRSLEDVSQHSIAPIAPGPVDRSVVSEALPPPGSAAVPSDQAPLGRSPASAGLRSVGRGPMTTMAGTAYGQQRLDDPNVATGGVVELPEDTVTIVKKTGQPARTDPNLPRSGTKLVADPGSGGLSSTVQVPQPVVDTGTNAPAPNAAPAAPPGSVVDTNTPKTDDSGFMSKPDIWSFLTSAGLGMMSSQSPDFLGAVGAGGTAGITQLGVLRKDQRERNKNLADAEFQRQRVALGYHDTNAANQRSDNQIRSNEKINTQNNQGLDRRQQTGIVAERDNLGTRLAHERDQTVLQSQLRKGEADYAQHLKLSGETDSLENRKKFFEDSGYSPGDAGRLAGGFNLPTDQTDKMSPMGEKEVAQSLDIAAGTIIGEGGTGQQLMALIGKLPSNVGSEVLRALRTQQDSGGGAAAVLDVLRKYGITYKEGGWFTDPSLSMSKTAPAPAATGGTSGSGNARYVPGQGIVR